MTSKTKLRLAVIVGLILLVAALAGVKAAQIGSMIEAGKSFVPPPETISIAKVEATEWQPTRAAIATLVAVRGVTLGAELGGTVRDISFDSGSTVKKGALLIRLDTSIEEAQLTAATADASLAKLSLERAHALRQGGSNSQADLDIADAKAKQTEATAASLRATIAKKTIRAPFDGRISIRQVELGQVLAPGTPIASLQSVDPIYAELALPQQALADLKVGQEASLRTDIFPGVSWKGQLSTINSEVDIGTRNVRLRATFENRDGRLRPGMFANVEILGAEKKAVLSIPTTAILYAPYGDSVFAVETEKAGPPGKGGSVARQKFVRLGERRGDFVAVISGLKAGETIVASGAFKLKNGMPLVVSDKVSTGAELAPKPSEP